MKNFGTRRDFLSSSAALAASIVLPGTLSMTTACAKQENWFNISVAQWSFQKEFYAGTMKNIDFPKFCQSELGIDAIDYLSDFFTDTYRDATFLKQMRSVSDDLGVKNLMIMCHRVGPTGHADPKKRRAIIEDHFRWIEAAQLMGCSTIRVNAVSSGTRIEQKEILAESLRELCLFGKDFDINVIVENLWGSDYSHNAEFIAELMTEVDMPNCGCLPDFNNFRYDNIYDSVQTMMPWAKSVSAKSLTFTPTGLEKYVDYHRMIQIIYNAGYRGYVGVEYEGCKAPPKEGVLLTKALLEDARSSIAA